MSAHEHGDADAPARVRRRPIGAVTWLTILVLIGIVQVVRRQWADAVFFGVAAALLGADALGGVRFAVRWRRPGVPALLLAAGAAVIAVGLAPRHSPWAMGAVGAVGAAALLAAWPSARDVVVGRWTTPLRALAWSWAAIWVVGCLWELREFVVGLVAPADAAAHPALSELLDPLLSLPVGQAVFSVCWIAVGVFLVTRGGSR